MKKYLKKEVIGDCTLYLGDCKNIIPNIKEKFCIITDPPYGIDFVASQPGAKKFDKIKNDDKSFEPSFLFEYSKNIILWGGNNFSNKLDLGGWIVWDKRCSIEADKMMGSPFELAWVSDKSKFKIARIQHGGVKNADYKTGQGNKKAERFHPTQKPIDLMIFCIDIFKKNEIILDPFMGSGTTGVACIRKNKKFIGIEIEEKYFYIACNRIATEYKRPWEYSNKTSLFEQEK